MGDQTSQVNKPATRQTNKALEMIHLVWGVGTQTCAFGLCFWRVDECFGFRHAVNPHRYLVEGCAVI